MKYLWEDPDVLKVIAANQKVSLFLDYDGTLTPITETPEKAQLSLTTKHELQMLSQITKYQVTIISGRALENVRHLVGIDGINYVGNHGYEIMLPGVEVGSLATHEYYELLERLKNEISQKLAEFPGAFIEDKGVTISVHYRQVSFDQAVVVEHALYRIAQGYFDRNEVQINLGKKVFEIRPPLDWNKGKAVLWILERQKGFPVYIGDDTTDEDAFLAIKGMGITVYVGKKDQASSCAQYYLNNTGEVIKFLEYLREAG